MNSSAITRVLGAITSFLAVASFAGQWAKCRFGYSQSDVLIYLFDVGWEWNIPSFFSVMLLLFASLLLLVIAVLQKKSGGTHVSKWGILSFGFLYISYDEAFAIHEKLCLPVREFVGENHLTFFYFAWLIAGIPLVVLLGLFYFRFLRQLPRSTRSNFLIAAMIYLGGALGFEMISGHYLDLYQEHDLTYYLLETVEETLEMFGVIVFIRALLLHLAEHFDEFQFRITS